MERVRIRRPVRSDVRGSAFSLAAIWRDLLGFYRDGETIEIQMATATALKASVPQRLPPPIQGQTTMKWTTPWIAEIAVGLEINSYASAELN
jgi:coenzyme PQQ precursor peptide PqqA